MGVGTREMGFLYGQYRRLAGHSQVRLCYLLLEVTKWLIASRGCVKYCQVSIGDKMVFSRHASNPFLFFIFC